MIGGLELVKDKRTKQSFDAKLGLGAKVVAFAQSEGLICRAVAGDTIGLCPPLVITEDEINAVFDMTAKALDNAHGWLKSEGHLGA